MSYLNANIPPIYCKIRREYLYDLKEHKGEAVDCVIFGLASISGRAILFHCMLPNGAVFMSKMSKIDKVDIRGVRLCMSKMSKMEKEHTHTFWLITSLILNGFSIRKKFWKAETMYIVY